MPMSAENSPMTRDSIELSLCNCSEKMFALVLAQSPTPGCGRFRPPCRVSQGDSTGCRGVLAFRTGARDCLAHQPLGIGRTLPTQAPHPLALLKILVVLEEVGDLLAEHGRQILVGLDAGVEGMELVDRHGQDLLVHAGL